MKLDKIIAIGAVIVFGPQVLSVIVMLILMFMGYA